MVSKEKSSSFWEKIDLRQFGDERGSLVSIERNSGLPFDIKRVYYIFGTSQGVTRGCHAHRNLDQVLIALAGSCKILVNDGHREETIELSRASVGLRIRNFIWREMYDFSPGCVLLVLASAEYDESDYIRSFDRFISLVK